MRISIILFCSGILASSCSQKLRSSSAVEEIVEEIDYSNQSVYNVSVGDTVQIYFENNSCCYICVPNQGDYKHLLYVGEKTVKTPGDELCMGCSSTFAELFIAKSVGTDTVKIGIYEPVNPCEEGRGKLDLFVVNVVE